jgi:modulator of FtsH protease
MRKQGVVSIKDADFKINQTVSSSVSSMLRKTYALLSLTLLFSAACAFYSMNSGIQINFIFLLVGMFGLQFLTMALRNSPLGIVAIFAFTGFMGLTLGPVLNMYLKNFSNGPELIGTALAATGLIFVTLSAYTIVSKKNFTYMGGVLSVGILIAFLAMIANYFLQISGLQLIISGAFAVVSAGYIMFMTSAIVKGGERNVIMATIMLFVSIFNLFISLLQILAAFGGSNK